MRCSLREDANFLLVTNGIWDVALAFEGGEPGALKRSPLKPEKAIFDPQIVWQTEYVNENETLLPVN